MYIIALDGDRKVHMVSEEDRQGLEHTKASSDTP